jgi:hypothetical protein
MFCVWPAAGNGKVALVWCGLDVCETQCSGFQSFAIVRFITTVQTVHDWLQQMGMGPCSWPQLASATFWLLHSSQSAQCSCLSVSEVDYNNNNIYLTAIGLSPGGSGYLHVYKYKKLIMNKFTFKAGGLHEKHVVATWNLGNHLSIRL